MVMSQISSSQFDEIEDGKKGEILLHAEQYGDWQTAVRYGREVGMSSRQLFGFLQRQNKVKEPKAEKVGKIGGEGPGRELGEEEQVFLQRVRDGDVGLDEASRKVAALVFEKMLKNPDDVRFGDFFKVEFLKIKQTEVQDKKNAATDMIHAMFGGKLPPKICPQCGFHLYQPTVVAKPIEAIEGEVVDND